MEIFQKVFYTSATITMTLLSIFGTKLLHEKSAEAKYQAQKNQAVAILGESDASIVDLYKAESLDYEELEKFHPLDETHEYRGPNNSAWIDLNPLEILEFAKYGITKSLKSKIQIVEKKSEKFSNTENFSFC